MCLRELGLHTNHAVFRGNPLYKKNSDGTTYRSDDSNRVYMSTASEVATSSDSGRSLSMLRMRRLFAPA